MPKNFFKRWKEGLKNLTPAQQLHAKMVCHLGGAAGIVLAIIVMLSRGIWYFALFLFFMTGLQLVEFIGARQRYEAAVKMMEEIETAKIYKKLPGGVNDGRLA